MKKLMQFGVLRRRLVLCNCLKQSGIGISFVMNEVL